MTNRRFSVLVILVLVMLLVLPGAALAGSSPLSPDAPEAPLVLTWTQRNASGFGDKNNAAVSALEFFGGMLYAGTTNDAGAQVWRTADGDHWSQVAFFNVRGQGVLFDMIVFNGQLYAGVGTWYDLNPPTTGQIWRTADGVAWNQISGAFDASNSHNRGVNNFAIFGGALYATTVNPSQGIEVYRSSTGNSNDWVRVAAGSFGLNNAYAVASGLAVFNNSLYVALDGHFGGAGARIYRTSDGATWTPANTAGFGSSNNYGAGGFGVHRGFLFVGTRNDVTGGQIWQSPDGAHWQQVATSGFGNPLNYKIEGLVSVMGTLFAFTDNDTTGTEVWSSVTSSSWQQSNIPGFGSANNKAVALWSNGAGVLANQLFLGTFNQAVGGQVWSATPPLIQMRNIYLPFVTKG